MPKRQYRVRNWCEYNNALVKRGSMTFWFSEEALEKWHSKEMVNGRGHPVIYSNMAIICGLTLRALFGLPLRAAEGLLKSLIERLSLTIRCPNYTTLCRRQKKGEELTNIVFDSTGLKVFGEGEWKVRQHGYSCRRTWRKLTLILDSDSQEIVTAQLSTNDYHDKKLLPDLIKEINERLGNAAGDGGYDSHECFEAVKVKGGNPVIVPRKDAKIKQHGNSKLAPLPRDEVVREIKKTSRKQWKIASGYHRRSLAETAMFRYKRLFGEHLNNHLFEHQATEAFICCRALNLMTQMGMPQSYPIH
jgi:hypothetical protein